MNKLLKGFLMVFALIALYLGYGFYDLSEQSQNMEIKTRVSQEKLMDCPDKPNCVSSFEEKDSEKNYIAPLELSEFKVEKLSNQLKKQNCKLLLNEENYFHYTCSTKHFKFTDDLELLFIPDEKLLYFRSASRVGYSDLGANKKRVEYLKSELK